MLDGLKLVTLGRGFFRRQWLTVIFNFDRKRAIYEVRAGLPDLDRQLEILAIAADQLKNGLIGFQDMQVSRQRFNELLSEVQRRVADSVHSQKISEGSIRNLKELLRSEQYRAFSMNGFRGDLKLIEDGSYREYYGLGPQWAVRRVREALLLIHYCGVTPQDMGFQPEELLKIVNIAESDALRLMVPSSDFSDDEVFFDGSSRRSFEALFASFREYLEG